MTNRYFQVFLGIAATLVLASTASANLLVNPGFEDTPFPGAEEAGAGSGWTGFSNFGGPFRVQCQPPGAACADPIGETTIGAHGGTVVLKAFGTSGAYQDFAASEGDSFSGSVWTLNPLNADIMTNSQIAFALIIFLDAGGIDLGATVASNVLTSADPQNAWNLLSVIATAPAGTTTARFQVMTDSNGDGGGAPRFDDASFQVVPIPGALLLMGPALLGLIGFRRKKVA